MNDQKDTIIDAALGYHERGWNVIPVSGSKKAVVAWKRWQTTRQSRSDVEWLFQQHPNSNVAIITGAVSGIVAVDADTAAAAEGLVTRFPELAHTLINRTAKGRHFVLKHPGVPVGNPVGLVPGVDVRGDGGYIIVPPSIHQTGVLYEWDCSGGGAPAAPSDDLLQFLTRRSSSPDEPRQPGPRGIIECVRAGVTQGQRNHTMAKLAGYYLGLGYSQTETLAACLGDNDTYFRPSLLPAEVERTVASISRREERNAVSRPRRYAVVQRMSDVTEERVDWLWRGYVPLGAVTMWDGEPGLGKSNTTLDLAARVTTGRPMPDGTPGVAGGVILLAPEDSKGAVVRPRLSAMGADLERVGHLTMSDGSLLQLPDDVEFLREQIDALDARLVIFDPLMGHIAGGVNSWSDQQSRHALTPLVQLAEEKNVAVLCVRHLTKKEEASALHAGSGSIAFVAMARAAFMIGRDPEDENGRVLAPVKFNLGKLPQSRSFRIVDAPNGASSVEWLGASGYSAAELRSKAGPPAVSKREEVARFTLDLLRNGPIPSLDLYTEGRRRGISDRTMERAWAEMGLDRQKRGFGGDDCWYVALPDNGDMTTNEAA